MYSEPKEHLFSDGKVLIRTDAELPKKRDLRVRRKGSKNGTDFCALGSLCQGLCFLEFYPESGKERSNDMEKETRVAVISTVIENEEAVGDINELFHAYSAFMIGRMGVPYRKKGINVITVVLDAPPDAISALSGKLGRIRGVTSKVLYAKNTKTDPQ